MSFRSILLAGAIAGLSAVSASAMSLSDRFSSFAVFGDSLSDPGNLFNFSSGTQPPPPYVDGRFSNGPVWNEPFLAEMEAAGKPWVNAAFGGALAGDGGQVPNLEEQLSLAAPFLPLAGDNPAAAVWMGANDLFAGIGSPDVEAFARQTANKVADAAAVLGQAGISTVFLFNLPDIGASPSYALLQPALAAQATLASNAYNAALKARISGLRASGMRIMPVDIAAAFEDLLANPAAFGVSDVTLPCVFPSDSVAALFGQPQVCDAATSMERAFFDGVHPNAAVHSAVGAIFAEQVAAVPLAGSRLAFARRCGWSRWSATPGLIFKCKDVYGRSFRAPVCI